MTDALPKVTIGLPVYNGAPHIRTCLECLARQTYGNFEVLISDNCSSDETADICRSFADSDPRFRYVRQAENLGLTGNLEFLLYAADGDYFCWRAHDDLSDDNFVETLAQMLRGAPWAALAATNSEWIDIPENYRKTYAVADTRPMPQYRRMAQQFHDCFGGWFYHLYRREALQKEWAHLRDVIGLETMHSDMLYLARFIASGRVVSAPGSAFLSQRLEARPYIYANAALEDYEKAVRLYRQIVREGLAGVSMPFWQKIVVRIMALRFLDRRVVRLKPYYRRKWKERRGA
ncbi:MAG: glycosyltransferase family 2 protein [Beijerinckiaceae bacterium]